MPDQRFVKKIYELHLGLYRELNDIHIFISHTIPLLVETSNRYSAMKDKTDGSFHVPTKRGNKGIAKRTPKEVAELFERFAIRELHANLLVASVSRLESLLNDVLRAFFVKYPAKLSLGLKGGDSSKTVPISTVTEAEDIDEVYRTIADLRIQSVFYVEPKDYLAYFESVSGVKLSKVAFLAFVEIKATRDLIIHNDGIVNELYERKASENARATIGNSVPLDDIYFASAISTMKSISSEIEKQVRAKYS